MELSEKLRKVFYDAAIKKNPEYNFYFNNKNIQSFLRDWLIAQFSNDEGVLDFDGVEKFIKEHIPDPIEWEKVKVRMINDKEEVKILTRIRVEVDIKTKRYHFKLPLLRFPKRKEEAFIDESLIENKENREKLFSHNDSWGVLTLRYGKNPLKSNEYAIWLVGFQPFRPWKILLSEYQERRKEFNIEEWIDVLLMAIDYNPNGFSNMRQKLTLLSRLLPFVHPRVNLIELAPKGTGKSYMMSQISKYGWLISGGKVTRAQLFFDYQRRIPGLVSRFDFVALDEIQTIDFVNDQEIAGALKGYLEMGHCQIGSERVEGSAGILLLGNIDSSLMGYNKNHFQELPKIFSESALLDRFHGFIEGWRIPRMKKNMTATGWALNVEYFSEILHLLREEIIFNHLISELLDIPNNADHRDKEAIVRLTTAFMKLLYPHARKPTDIDVEEFEEFCLNPAKEMRKKIKEQLHILDPGEYEIEIPEIKVKSVFKVK